MICEKSLSRRCIVMKAEYVYPKDNKEADDEFKYRMNCSINVSDQEETILQWIDYNKPMTRSLITVLPNVFGYSTLIKSC